MASQQSQTIAQKLCEAFNSRDIDHLDSLIASNCIDHTAAPDHATALEGLKQAWAQIYFTFPHSRLSLTNLSTNGDQVILKALFQHHTPHGREETAMLLELFRVVESQIVEVWNLMRWN